MTSLQRDTGWFKSTHSGAASEACVEVRITDHAVAVRDSKSQAGPMVTVTPAAWATFVAGAGRFAA